MKLKKLLNKAVKEEGFTIIKGVYGYDDEIRVTKEGTARELLELDESILNRKVDYFYSDTKTSEVSQTIVKLL